MSNEESKEQFDDSDEESGTPFNNQHCYNLDQATILSAIPKNLTKFQFDDLKHNNSNSLIDL